MHRCARYPHSTKTSKALREAKASKFLQSTRLLLERDITIVDTHGIWPYAQYKHRFC